MVSTNYYYFSPKYCFSSIVIPLFFKDHVEDAVACKEVYVFGISVD